MDFLTFTTKLFEFSAWPVAAVVICSILRNPLKELFGRLTSAKHKDTEFGFAPKTQASPDTSRTSDIKDAIPKDTTGLMDEAEQRIYESLKELNIESDEDKVKVLVKHHANLQIRGAYSQINSSIYGSQLKALNALNCQTEPVETSFFKSFYDDALAKHEEQFSSFSFETWLNYLKSAGLVRIDNEKYSLTKFGRGFLIYLTEAGLEQHRAY